MCYHETGDNMNKKNTLDDFGTEDTYKLYRTVYEIIHPTISKKNISNYKIVMQDDLVPLRIFYPKKISKIEKVIIYIHGKRWIVNGVKDYTDICQNLVKELDLLVIALDYTQDWYHKTVEICKNTLEYLIQGLKRVGIEKESLTLMGDSTGASILASITQIEQAPLPKQILLYPALNLTFEEEKKYPSLEQNNELDLLTLNHLKIYEKNYIDKNHYCSPLTVENYKSWPITLIITGDLDPIRDEGMVLAQNIRKENKESKILNIKFASHGFLNSKDEESIEEAMKEIKKFISKKER